MPNEPERAELETDRQYLPKRGAPAAPFGIGRGLPLLAALISAFILNAGPALARGSQAGHFDYYALSLSWSPSYCAGGAGSDDNQQCGPGRAYAFVVHGLWPQYEQDWPEFCGTRERWVPDDVIDTMLTIMPSKRLIIHQWKKHGACSGLSVSRYFAATRTLFEKVRIPARYLSPRADIVTTPDQLVKDFVKTNRDLSESMISVQCGKSRDRARLSELRICFDRAGEFRACGENEARQCRATHLVLPPVRGGQ